MAVDGRHKDQRDFLGSAQTLNAWYVKYIIAQIINNDMLGQIKWEQTVFLGNPQLVGFIMKLRAIMKLNLPVAFAVVLAASNVFCQNAQTSTDRQAARPLNMLVLGDSVLWGQGLKAEHNSA
jgi:hypothetical protein